MSRHSVITTTSVALFALPTKVFAMLENTADVCTANISNLKLLRPSECDPTGRVGPDITVGSTIYNNDEAHFVIGSPKTGAVASELLLARELMKPKYLRHAKKRGEAPRARQDSIVVYLPGTTDFPALSSCLLQSVASNGIPTIGLTYGFLSRGDGFRNTRCASLPDIKEQVECLEEQHIDAIYGGTYGADRVYNGEEFWQPVDPRDSISGRLGLLLAKLDSNYPDAGWDAYYTAASGSYPDSLPTPNWSKITFMGHSQGAGHAGYLAATKDVHGATLISGPQDECIDCPVGTTFWIDETFKSKHMTAFAHGDASEAIWEPTLPIIEDNWARMRVWSSPLEVVNVDGYVDYNVCRTPIVSRLLPSSTSPCGRRGHCSTALDDSSPVVPNTDGDNVYVFGIDIWSTLADVDKCV